MASNQPTETRVWEQTATFKSLLRKTKLLQRNSGTSQPPAQAAGVFGKGQDSPALRVSVGAPADTQPLTRSRFVSSLPSLSSGTTMLAFSLGVGEKHLQHF